MLLKYIEQMIKKINNLITYLTQKPQLLFLIDSLGALLTTVSLFVVGLYFNEYVGLPQTTFTYLSLIAFSFCIYSATCFFFLKDNWVPFIWAISIANFLYCILTALIVLTNLSTLPIIGITYFLIEIIIVCTVVYVELKVAKVIHKHKV